MPTYLIVLLALSVIVAAVFATVMVRWALQQSDKDQGRRALLDELTQSGQRGQARIVESVCTGLDLYGNGKSAFKLRLEIFPEHGGASYVVDRDPTCAVGLFVIAAPFASRLTRLGESVPVLIHPANPNWVVLDTDKIEAQANAAN
jgi:hypothetical protein